MPIPIAALAAGASALSTLGSTFTSIWGTNKTNQANMELAKYQYRKDLEMWNRQNEYNSPAAQMQRLKDAGLNPNLIYGNGSASTGNATQLPKYQAPHLQYNYQAPDFGSMIQTYQDVQLKQAQIDNVRAAADLTKQRELTEQFNTFLRGVQGKTADYQLSEQAPYQTAVLKQEYHAGTAKVEQEFEKLRKLGLETMATSLDNEYRKKKLTAIDIDNEKRQADLLYMQYRNEFARIGITSGDHIGVRLLVRMLASTGIDVQGLLGRQ